MNSIYLINAGYLSLVVIPACKLPRTARTLSSLVCCLELGVNIAHLLLVEVFVFVFPRSCLQRGAGIESIGQGFHFLPSIPSP